MWVKSRNWDIFWVFSPLWSLPLVLIFMLFFHVDNGVLRSGILKILAMLHLSFPVMYAFLFTTQYESNKDKKLILQSFILLFVLVTLFFLGLNFKVLFSPLLLVLFPSVVALWATWHFYRQDLGFMSLYRSRSSIKDVNLIRLDRAIVVLFSLANPLHYWFRTGYRYYALKPFVDLSFLDHFLPWQNIRIAALIVLIFYYLVQLKYKVFLNPRTIYVTILFFQVLSMSTLYILPAFFEYYFRIFFHNTGELGLQVLLWGQMKKQSSFSYFIKAVVAASIYTMVIFFITQKYPFIGLNVDLGFFDAKKFLEIEQNFMMSLFVIIVIGTNLLHFFFGRHVYNFGQPEVKGILKL